MATEQLPANYEAQKASLEKLIKESKEKAGPVVEAASKDQNMSRTQGYFFNNHKVTGTRLRMIYSVNWSGNSSEDAPVPQTLEWGGRSPMFVHQGPRPGGSVAGFVYADGDANDGSARKWLVAFDGQNQKVCVEAGPMGPVDWNAIKYKLDHLSGPISTYEDPVLKGKASASYDGEPLYISFYN